MKIILRGAITAIEPDIQRRWISGVGKDALTKDVVVGYYIVVNSILRIYTGEDKPLFSVGDTVTLTIAKETLDALDSRGIPTKAQ